MGKAKNRKHREDNAASASKKSKPAASNKPDPVPNVPPPAKKRRRSLYSWCVQERQGIVWVIGCAILGALLGFGIGSGYLTGEANNEANAWRVSLGAFIRSTLPYKMVCFKVMPWEPLIGLIKYSRSDFSTRRLNMEGLDLSNDPSHPRVFAVLREAIVREKGGYVHPDLGPLSPAPCDAARGVGMVTDNYHKCQTKCIPGVSSEKLFKRENATEDAIRRKQKSSEQLYKQEEVLLKIPLSFQMTRAVALEVLLPRISAEVQRRASLHELDDAALLVLLLAHERGVGRFSRWLPYIASLPVKPSCGYSKEARPLMLDSINALRDELDLDIYGWHEELVKAEQYADRVATALTRDYGLFLQHPKGISATENMQWALCQVASRATGGSQKHGALRMVPILDMVNHDANAGGFVELTGKERFDNGDFVDASEEDSGAYVIRSLRHGRRKALRKGQELLANYNVPHYSSLDWFVSLGFVPPERWSRWQKIEGALPRMRKDGPFAEETANTADIWRDFSPDL